MNVKYWTFHVLDEAENILNAIELIEQCIKIRILYKTGPVSFFQKDKHYVDRIKNYPSFVTGTLIKLQIGIPQYIHQKIIAKKDKEREYRLLLAQYTFGIKLCTIKEINDIINNSLQ